MKWVTRTFQKIMAICLRCKSKMGQTEAICPHCGYDFPPSAAGSSLFAALRNIFWLCVALGAMAVVFQRVWPTFRDVIASEPYQSYLHELPPDFVESGKWMNADEPLNLRALQGKVVWLQFNLLHCGTCTKMSPCLVDWDKAYGEEGLIIIEVYNGLPDKQFSQQPLVDIQEHLKRQKDTCPVLYDEDGATCDRYGVKGYPSGYLIGRDGRVVWEGLPYWHQTRIERRIRKALREDRG